MVVLSWREVDFLGVLVSSLVAGYVMTVIGLWAGRVPGLVAFDIADLGRRYMASDRPSAWLFGLLSHLANSIVFTLFWSMLLIPNIHISQLWLALIWSVVLAFGLSGSLISPMAGLGFMGRKTGSYHFARTNVILHLVWGLCIGIIYRVPG